MISQNDQLEGQVKVRQMGEMEKVLEKNLNRYCRDAKPMPVVAGRIGPARNGIAPSIAPEDPEFLARTKGLRLKNEGLVAFIARTGVSLHQIHTLAKDALKRLIEIKAQNADAVVEPKRPAKLIPDNMHVTFDASGLLDAHLAPRMPANVVETWTMDN